MKHLKTFESISDDEIAKDLKDICLELTDIGFDINTFMSGGKSKIPSSISIFKRGISRFVGSGVYFSYGEIEEVVERIKEFMKLNKISIEIVLRYKYKGEFIIFGSSHNGTQINRDLNDRIFDPRVREVKINFLYI